MRSYGAVVNHMWILFMEVWFVLFHTSP